MSFMSFFIGRAAILAAVCLVALTGDGLAQTHVHHEGDIGVTFGLLTDTCAFEFALFDATAGGTRLGPVIERTLRVRGGLYETGLDFGPEAFDGGARYLEVAVGCPAETAALTTLTRRAFHSASGQGSDRGDTARSETGGEGAPTKAALGTAFTYQGELLQSGAAVTGSGDFQFSLWDALQGGSQIGATVPADGVSVVDGRFTAVLDFGAAAFDGDARWLAIAVDFPSGTGSWTTLSPRQMLSAAPYALQTRGIHVDDAGEVGVGTTNPTAPLHVVGDASSTLRVRNDAVSGGVAISATAAAHTGWATAVSAYTASPGGVGVYSFNEAESGNGFAMAAETNSPNGVAIYGHAASGIPMSNGIGVSGRSDGDDGASGVFGESTGSGGASFGVRGIATAGTGVRGEHQGTGNRGSLGTGSAGVHGYAFAADDYSGYFAGGRNYFEGSVGVGTSEPTDKLHVSGGDARVDGKVIAGTFENDSEKTYFLHFPTSAFRQNDPTDDDVFFVNGSLGYISSGDPHHYGVNLSAPVRLPENATVVELTIFYYDDDPVYDLTADLNLFARRPSVPSGNNLISVNADSSGSTALILSASEPPASTLIIDNRSFQYVLSLNWGQDELVSRLKFYGCRIEYTLTTLNP